jgi:hypothetical protein
MALAFKKNLLTILWTSWFILVHRVAKYDAIKAT